MLGYSIFGFIFFDTVYIAAVVNYAAQCEMNIYLLQSIKIRILSRKYSTTDEAIKVDITVLMMPQIFVVVIFATVL